MPEEAARCISHDKILAMQSLVSHLLIKQNSTPSPSPSPDPLSAMHPLTHQGILLSSLIAHMLRPHGRIPSFPLSQLDESQQSGESSMVMVSERPFQFPHHATPNSSTPLRVTPPALHSGANSNNDVDTLVTRCCYFAVGSLASNASSFSSPRANETICTKTYSSPKASYLCAASPPLKTNSRA